MAAKKKPRGKKKAKKKAKRQKPFYYENHRPMEVDIDADSHLGDPEEVRHLRQIRSKNAGKSALWPELQYKR